MSPAAGTYVTFMVPCHRADRYSSIPASQSPRQQAVLLLLVRISTQAPNTPSHPLSAWQAAAWYAAPQRARAGEMGPLMPSQSPRTLGFQLAPQVWRLRVSCCPPGSCYTAVFPHFSAQLSSNPVIFKYKFQKCTSCPGVTEHPFCLQEQIIRFLPEHACYRGFSGDSKGRDVLRHPQLHHYSRLLLMVGRAVLTAEHCSRAFVLINFLCARLVYLLCPLK